MAWATLFILLVILTAFIFDFINGFHDAANSVATIIATGILTPRQAVLWAAFFNCIAFMVFNLMVAKTIGEGLVNTSIVEPHLIFAALLGAITLNLATWYYGLPSSSSHALIGGLAGAALIKGGLTSLKLSGFIKVAIGIFIAPVIGLVIGFSLSYFLNHLLKKQSRKVVNKAFKIFQLASSALLSLTHGGNDAQKTMGIIAVLLFSTSWIKGAFYIPFWVVISCQIVISLGTLAGGWRIINTMGTKITDLNPMRGCAAETGAALIIFVTTMWGVPVSTTHTLTGTLAGVGLTKGLKKTQRSVLMRIFASWLLVIPAAGLVAAAVMLTSRIQ